MFYLSNIFAV